MILDNMKNYSLYVEINKNFQKAFSFIENAKKNPPEIGRYEIEGSDVYALVQEYDSKDAARFEAHQNYIDIQYIIAGKEEMQFKDLAALKEQTSYNPEKDVTFYHDPENYTSLCVSADEYAVFFPSDGHKPGLNPKEGKQKVKKIVVKVRVSFV